MEKQKKGPCREPDKKHVIFEKITETHAEKQNKICDK